MALLTFVKNGIADAGQAAHLIGNSVHDFRTVSKCVRICFEFNSLKFIFFKYLSFLVTNGFFYYLT